MEKIVKQGGLLFAIAILAFGVEHIACVRFGPSITRSTPATKSC